MVDISVCIMLGVISHTITFMLRYTDGPFDLFLRFRALTGVTLPVYLEDTDEVMDYMEPLEHDTFISKLVSCFWCFTTWISLVVTVLAYILLDIGALATFPFTWIFVIGVSGLLYQYSD